MPQSANDQVELVYRCAEWELDEKFQCLSRQTIKWNIDNPCRTPAHCL